MVVAHHLEAPGFDGGFIGVDVFFVISGFLIASKLLRDSAGTGRLRLLEFWAGRVRRLLPLATTVIVTTLGASLLVLNPMRWHAMVDDARAAALFVANEHFARTEQSYFGTAARESPFLHFWSLGVEEQFYAVFPVVLALALAARRGSRSLELPVLALTGLMGVSAMVAHQLTIASSEFAYYSLGARGWELCAGVLLAFGWGRVEQIAPNVRAWIGHVGFAVLVAGLVFVDRAEGFPAWGAGLPVVGTLAVIAAEPATDGAGGRFLTLLPVRAVGRWSYGWYLWHWPALILGRAAFGDGFPVSLTAAAASLGLAALTYRFVELPPRRHGKRPARTIAFGAAAVATTLLAVSVAGARSDQFFADPARAALREASADFVDIPFACIGVDADVLRASCVEGDRSDAAPLVLYGDSHMSHWRPAIQPAARRLGFPVVHSIQGNCFPIGDGQVDPPPFCDSRAAGVEDLVDDLDPSGFVLSTATVYRNLRDGDRLAEDQLAAWETAVARLAAQLRDRGVPLLVLLDTPRYLEFDPIECMAEHGAVARCALERRQEVDRQRAVNRAIRTGVATANHGTVFDTTDLVCPEAQCLLVDRGIVVPQDAHHVTARWARTQSDLFEDLLARVLGVDPAPP